MHSKRAFITGLEGFTGHHLAAELSTHGIEVFGTMRQPSPHLINNAFECDIRDTERLTKLIAEVKPDFIINLAGISFINHGSPKEIYEVNQLGALSLLNAISASKHLPQKILLASSAIVYGSQSNMPLNEASELKPNSHYAISKLAMENIASLWFDKLPIIVTRPFNYTGALQPLMFLVPKIISHFAEKSPSIELGNIDIMRDWSDVRDVAYAYRLLLESGAHGLIVNVCSGMSYSIQFMLDTLAKITGHHISVKVNPKFVRQNDVKILLGNNALLNSLVGDIKSHDLFETLVWMYESYVLNDLRVYAC